MAVDKLSNCYAVLPFLYDAIMPRAPRIQYEGALVRQRPSVGFAFAFECPRRPGRVQHRLDGSGAWQQLLSAEPIRERDSGFCARLCGGTAWREAEVIGTFCQERRGGYDGVLLPVLVFRPGGKVVDSSALPADQRRLAGS